MNLDTAVQSAGSPFRRGFQQSSPTMLDRRTTVNGPFFS